MAKAQIDAVIDELGLTPEEFWSPSLHGRSITREDLDLRVRRQISKAAVKTAQRVGSTNYAVTTGTQGDALAMGEHSLSCANMLRQRLVILSSRPEEAPPPEYIDLQSLAAEIERYERDWAELIEPYVTQETDRKGGFSFGSVGVDETEEDDYDDIDYGNIT